MLETLLRIGKWQSQGKSKWDRFLEYPKVDTEKNGRKITNYTLPIIFDLDEGEVVIEQENLKEYEESDVQEYLAVELKGRRSKKIITSAPSGRLNYLHTAFFGKIGETSKAGDIEEAINNDFPDLLEGNLKNILHQILPLEDVFRRKTEFTKQNGKKEISIKEIEKSFELDRNQRITFLICKVKTSEFGFETPTSFSKIEPYKEFLNQMYFPNPHKDKTDNKNSNLEKLCYASGEVTKDVKDLNLTERYSLNKMFVTETKNYASVFDKKKFSLNYQVSSKNQELLDYASDFLLNHGYKVRIANLNHVIIPQFLSTSAVDLEYALNGIQTKSDLLFTMKAYKKTALDIEDEVDKKEIFWINFIAFESDGNSFKSTEVIKDVSNFHFNKIMENFDQIDIYFRENSFVNWDKVITEYGEPRYFNFNSLYEIIPFRKDKEKKNKALDLFKTILENRKVKREILFDYFTELILCHYYNRYKSYTNVHDYSQKGNRKRKDYFKWAVRDSVFKYLAFFQFLKNLNLINMEETQVTEEKKKANHDKEVQNFFTEMNYSQEQKAMFFLGRMLNSVEYIQEGKNKTVIQKVNFNGMDKDNIQRLRTGLIEKAKQYNAIGKVIFTDNKFSEQFDYNNWDLNSKEALFFLLTGYSFGAKAKKQDDGSETTENN